MPNRLSFSSGGAAARLYASLRGEERSSLDRALDYIKDAPFAHSETVTAHFAPPVVVYVYQDEDWRISYTLGFLPAEAAFDINIHAIARR